MCVKLLLPCLVKCSANTSFSWALTVEMGIPWVYCHCVCTRVSYSSLYLYPCGIWSGGGWLVATVLYFESYDKLRVSHHCHWTFQCNGWLPYVSLCYSLLKSTFLGMECKFQCKNVNLWKPRLLLSATWVLSNLLEANQILLGNPAPPLPPTPKSFARGRTARSPSTFNWSAYDCHRLRSSLGFCRTG